MVRPPSWIELSLSDACTRTCPWCPKGSDAAPQQALYMDTGLIRRIAAQLTWRPTVCLAGWGEPLLGHAVEATAMLSPRARVEIVTNGDKLDKGVAASLYAVGCSKISVSNYGGKDFSFLAGMGGEHEIRERSGGPDILTNRGGVLNQKGRGGPCYYPLYSMSIDWNGDCLLCPQDWQRRVKLGNLHAQPILAVWRGNIYEKWRESLRTGREWAPCRNCDCLGTRKGHADL